MSRTVPPPPAPYRAPRPAPPAPYRAPERAPERGVSIGGGTLALVVTGALVALALVVRPQVLFGLVVVAAIFVPLERLFTLRPQRVLRAGWRTDTVHFVVNNVLSTAGLFVVVVIVAVLVRGVIPSSVASTVQSQPWWAQFAEALVLTEVTGYFAHRATHRVPLLWRFHSVHHSIAEMDWLASARLHPVDQIFMRTCIVLPLFLLGFSRATFGAYLVFATVWALFIHANVRFTFGPLRWVVTTPQFHHWHHTNDDGRTNRNFAGQLPVLDVIFGTAHQPRHEWPRTYGIDDPAPPTYAGQMVWPFRQRPASAA